MVQPGETIYVDVNSKGQPVTLAAHFDGKEYTEDEQNEINDYIFTQGTVGVLCQPPDTYVKGGWC